MSDLPTAPRLAANTHRAMLKVCLIDDDRLVRGALALGLEDGGFEVFAAENGEVGLDLIEREKPDVVMTDLRMPGMDGGALIGLIRARYPDLPIVAMSGDSSDDGGAADVFLHKPFKIRDASAAMISALAKRRGHAP